jgi:transposase
VNKRDKNSIYSVNMTAEDEKIKELEDLRARICDELEDAAREYARASRRRRFRLPRIRLNPILQDGYWPEA